MQKETYGFIILGKIKLLETALARQEMNLKKKKKNMGGLSSKARDSTMGVLSLTSLKKNNSWVVNMVCSLLD